MRQTTALKHRRNIPAIVAVVLFTLLGISTTSTMVAPPATAAGEILVVGMPFPGKWAWNVPAPAPWNDDVLDSHPAAHEQYAADWATDLYAAPDTTVKLLTGYTNGSPNFVVSSVTNTSCNAGKRVRVDIQINGGTVGWVQYDHLDTAITTGTTVYNGSILGRTKNWGNLSCYVVANDSGVHVHVGMKNIQSNFACYADKGQPGSYTIPEGDSLGVVGSSNNGARQACTSVPQPDNDADDDGILNNVDQCPNVAGQASNNGCPITDSDGDGTFNTGDACPMVYGKAFNRGCRVDGHTVSGNFVGNDGFTDTVTFYDYTASNLGVFLSTGSVNGLSQPQYRWSTGQGAWTWGNSLFYSGNFAGNDVWTDVIGLYDYGNGTMGAFLFQGNGNGVNQPQHLWTMGPNAWGMGSAKYVVGNFAGNDGNDDIMAFYGYPGNNMGVFVLAGNGSGVNQPVKQWETGVGQWNILSAEFLAGNFAGNDSLTDVVALYHYDGNDTGAFVFQGTSGNLSQPQFLWSTGPGQWNLTAGHYVAGSFAGGDGNTDIAVLYDYDDSNTAMFVLAGNGSGVNQPVKQWETGPGQWGMPRAKAFVGNFGGNTSGISVFYNYDNSNTAGFLLAPASTGVNLPVKKWETGVNAWSWHAM